MQMSREGKRGVSFIFWCRRKCDAKMYSHNEKLSQINCFANIIYLALCNNKGNRLLQMVRQFDKEINRKE